MHFPKTLRRIACAPFNVTGSSPESISGQSTYIPDCNKDTKKESTANTPTVRPHVLPHPSTRPSVHVVYFYHLHSPSFIQIPPSARASAYCLTEACGNGSYALCITVLLSTQPPPACLAVRSSNRLCITVHSMHLYNLMVGVQKHVVRPIPGWNIPKHLHCKLRMRFFCHAVLQVTKVAGMRVHPSERPGILPSTTPRKLQRAVVGPEGQSK